MRAALVSVVALTFCLAGAYPRIGNHPETKPRKEFGKGLAVGGLDIKDEDERTKDEDERDDHDEHREEGDEPSVEGRVKETSVRRKHFMDQYYLQSGPVKYEYGHVCEDPRDWEHRYENRDFEKNRHQGQVKWGDANGGRGEQLWDFNHDGKESDEDKYSDEENDDEKKDEEERNEELTKEHRFQKPRKKIQIKEKIVEKTTDDNGSREFRRSKTGSTTYSGHEKEEGKYEEVITKKKKKNEDPFLFDPVIFDSVETTPGFTSLDFDFDHHGLDFDHHDFDIDRMGKLASGTKIDIPPLSAFLPPKKKSSKEDEGPDVSLEAKNALKSEVRKGYATVKEEIERVDVVPTKKTPILKGKRDNRKKNFSVEEHKEIRKYRNFFPGPILKRSLKMTSSTPNDKDSQAIASKNVDAKKLRVDPIAGSLTDKKTGKMFKIFGILMDS